MHEIHDAPVATPSAELAVLNEELTRLTTVEAYAASTEIAIVAAQVVVHAGVLSLIRSQAQARAGASTLPDAIWLLVPLVPYWIMGFHLMLGAKMTLRGFYIRAVERRVHELSGASLRLDMTEKLQAPSYAHIAHLTASSRSVFPEQKALYNAGLIVMQCLMAAEAWYCILQPSDVRWRLAGTTIYVFLFTLILGYVLRITLGGGKLWQWTLRSIDAGWARPFGEQSIMRPSRGLRPPPEPELRFELEPMATVAYLVHPRPWPETLNKSLLGGVILGLALARGGSGPVASEVLTGGAIWLIFEWLIYPSRYYVNDLLDTARKLPPAEWRSSRPQIGHDVHVTAVVKSLGVRLALGVPALYLASVQLDLHHGLAWVSLWLVLLVVSIAMYEAVRRTFAHADNNRLPSRVLFLAYTVGLWSGYALKAFVALTAGLGGSASWAAVLFAAGAGLLGTAAVVLHLSDLAVMTNRWQHGSLTRDGRGHMAFLLAKDEEIKPRPVPGIPRLRERNVKPSSPIYWLMILATPLLVTGFTLMLGQLESKPILGIVFTWPIDYAGVAGVGVAALVLGWIYLSYRRSPTLLWVPTLPLLMALTTSLILPGYGYYAYLWAASPMFATLAYFEWFRDTPPAAIGGYS